MKHRIFPLVSAPPAENPPTGTRSQFESDAASRTLRDVALWLSLPRFVRAAAQSGYGFRAICIALSEERYLDYDATVRFVRQTWPSTVVLPLLVPCPSSSLSVTTNQQPTKQPIP